MYHPERFNQSLSQTIRGIEKFTSDIYRYFLPQKLNEITGAPARSYRPRTFEGIYRHRLQLRRGEILIPRDELLLRKYQKDLKKLQEEEATSPDGLNCFTRPIIEGLKTRPAVITRNGYPYRIPEEECTQFNVWYNSDTPVYDRAMQLAVAAYMDGLDPEDLAIWMNIPRNKSILAVEHAQVVVKRYQESWHPYFQHLPVRYMHPDLYPNANRESV